MFGQDNAASGCLTGQTGSKLQHLCRFSGHLGGKRAFLPCRSEMAPHPFRSDPTSGQDPGCPLLSAHAQRQQDMLRSQAAVSHRACLHIGIHQGAPSSCRKRTVTHGRSPSLPLVSFAPLQVKNGFREAQSSEYHSPAVSVLSHKILLLFLVVLLPKRCKIFAGNDCNFIFSW